MGLLRATRTPGQRVEAALNPTVNEVRDPATLPIATPWGQSDTLTRIVYEDVFGTDLPINTRTGAMGLPPVARSRNLIVSTICRAPLRAYRGAAELGPAEQPSWLYRTDRSTSPQLRLAWTVDDLMFYGWSCWRRVNSTETGFPLTVDRVPREDWSINEDNRVEIHGTVVPDDSVILIPGLHEGILTFGRSTLADTRTLYGIVRQRLLNPVPQVDLHQTGGEPLTDTEIDGLIDRWATARRGGNGGVAYTNETIDAKEMGNGGDAALLIEARNAAAVDLARIVGITASRIDATAPKASLNYETTTGRNQELVDFDLALYMTPITARLSLDDVVPRGTRVGFDLTDLTGPTPSPNGPNTED